MTTGFCVSVHRDRIEFQFEEASEPPSQRLVSFHETGQGAAVLLGRLYYQQDLRARLGRSDAAELADNPAALAWQAYCCKGAAGLELLEGDFVVVLWDRQRRQLLAARDPFGGFPLYWTGAGSRLRLASSMGLLFTPQSVPELDLEFVADFLSVAGPAIERVGQRCIYQGVSRLPAGSIQLWGLDDQSTRTYGYWDWLREIEQPSSDRLGDLAEEYRVRLQQATLERMRGTVASHVSGGMDSTAVALLARDDLAARGAGPLHAISLTYQGLEGLQRERSYVESAWRQPGMVIHDLNGDELLDFNSFADPPPHDEPYVALWRMAMDRATIDAAAGAGAQTLLTGLGADEVLDLQPFHLADLVSARRFGSAWREACRWAKADHVSPWGMLQQFGLSEAFERGSLRLLRPFLPSSPLAPLLQAERHGGTPWIRREFASRYALADRVVAERQGRFHGCDSTALSFALSSLASRVGDVARWSLAAPRGMMIAHPFLDLRVVRFALGVMRTLPPDPDHMKPLLAEAMRGVLPEDIRTRRRKGHFNEVYYRGLARNRRQLEALVDHPVVESLGIFDRAELLTALQRGALGGAGVRPLHQLNLTLCFLRWLSLREQRHHWERPSSSRSLPVQLSCAGGELAHR